MVISRAALLRGKMRPEPSEPPAGVPEAGVHVTSSCLAHRGVVCRVCEDTCEVDAIRFRPEPGGRGGPLVDLQLCTSCGTCADSCPEGAILAGEATP
jgi:ferredoxin-type protein NapF